MLDTNYLRSVGIDESTLRRMERDNTYKEEYNESMRGNNSWSDTLSKILQKIKKVLDN